MSKLLHFLITAGPTREYLDSVRFLTNASSGKMGYACAAAAVRRGHKVTLISGPVHLTRPQGAKLVSVVSAADMAEAVARHFPACDCVIMTAAVCDYRPKNPLRRKLRKDASNMLLELERTDDILAGLGKAKGDKILIGFAVQDHAARRNARRKLREKNLDAIVLNRPAAFMADKADVEILPRRGAWITLPGISKTSLATKLVKLAEELSAKKQQ